MFLRMGWGKMIMRGFHKQIISVLKQNSKTLTTKNTASNSGQI